MNILVQAPKYANKPARRCNSFIAAFIAAFILFYFTCAAGLILLDKSRRLKLGDNILRTLAYTLCLKKTSPMFSAITRDSIVGFS